VAGVAVLLASCTSHSGSIVPSSVDGVASISTNRVSASARNPQLVWKANGASHAPKAVNISFERAPAQGTVILVVLKNDGKVGGGANTYTAPAGWTLFDSDTSHARSTYEAFYHVAGRDESNAYAFTPSCDCGEHVWMAAVYANVSVTSPIDAHGFAFVNGKLSWTTPNATPSHSSDVAVVSMLPSTSGATWSNADGWDVDIAPPNRWSTELLQQNPASTGAVSETSVLSHRSSGYAAIVLLNARSASTTKADWPTWGMSPYRNSYNPVETTLTTSNAGSLHQLWSMTAGGVFTDEPVLISNVSGTSSGTADVLYVGDAHANFYAIDAQTGKVLWTKTLQTQVINGDAPSTKGCFDQPAGTYGIGGSPTVDRRRGIVYVVDGQGNLYGFNLATGTQQAGPVRMWPFQNGVNITNDYGALNEDVRAGVIYVPGSAHCGLANYGGIHRYKLSNGTVTHFYTEGGPPNTYGGVWGPGGATIDPRYATDSTMNNIYFGTAYGPLGTGKYPYSVVRTTRNMGLVAANNPVSTTCCPDLDFGDTPLVFTPTPSGCGRTLLAAESKDSKLFVYDADAIDNGPLQTIQLGTLSVDGENVGTAAYDPKLNLVFIQNGSDSSEASTGLHHGLVAFTVTAGCTLQLAWQETVGPKQVRDGPPAPPTVANGVVYYADGPGSGTCSPVGNSNCTPTSDFYAFNAVTGAMLFHATLPGPLFTPPVVVNGRVYLTSWNGHGPGIVYAFGL
jgi:outer membrane protein assembly factor BamB